ncbi:FAD-dependent oxidoreductase [Tsukamurella sp. 8F]|uniref:FAD-dependent oxidoreductase n=1 Tax=unclassified Tsukamurella TaxID=2633480 RepID=UPI0023B9D497|nr:MULTISPECIES: FAD-dependent oxidoreductase [unclassified Tsukamurella]MDF0530447.1 FAD-dependent oxidoreductase [Tsukamurella sp. 8J]MDF0587732.1 FAD-dependent oxidoreductase [Tsukamurella sp. 8F]
MISRLDDLLGRVTMYRLVTLCLAALVALSFGYACTGVLDGAVFRPGAMAGSLVVLLAASVASSRALGLTLRTRPHTESAVITALLLWFLYWPQSSARMLAWLALAAALANASKYVLAIRRRHVFNPAAAGAVLTTIAAQLAGVPVSDRLLTTWWAASEPLLPFVIVAALLVLRRTRRIGLGVTFVLVAGALIVIGLASTGTGAGAAAKLAAVSYPLVFLGGFMLSEPLTLPPRRWQQLVIAVVAGFVVAWPVFSLSFLSTPPHMWIFDSTAELALLAANLIAFGFGQRGGIRLELVHKRELPGGVWEFVFEPLRPVRFAPGQYVELHLPHAHADRRGVRRVFSIASAPSDSHVCIALRVPEPASSYKQAMLALEPGTVVSATGVGGDFLLPTDPTTPVVLVAGGIGITPFLSHLRHGPRDAVLVYGVSDGDAVAFREELIATDVPVVLVSPTAPAELPEGWSHVAAPFIRPEDLPTTVPGLRERVAYVSGPPSMVHAVRRGLAPHVARTRTDYFSGY